MNWLFKLEKLPYDQRRAFIQGERPRELSVTEISKRRWQIKKADQLLVISGSGDGLAFVAHGTVESVKQWEEPLEFDALSTEEEPRSLVQIELKVADLEPFPEDRVLANFMFSLEKVYNFSEPWRHFRHRSGISDTDFTTLVEGRIAWDRSVFYGLLRHLPDEWRNAFELQAQLDALGSPVGPRSIAGVPALFSLLERSAVTALSLSSEVSILATSTFPEEQLNLVMGVGEDSGQQSEIDLLRLFRLAQNFAQPAEEQFRKLLEEDEAITALRSFGIDDLEGRWLHHHW